jgi:hypothetical protein
MTSVLEPKITSPGERYHRAWLMEPSQSGYARQLSRRSFRSFVIANLRDNEIGLLLYLYRHHTGGR